MTTAAAPSFSPFGSPTSHVPIRRWLKRIWRFGHAHPRLARALRIGIGAVGTWAIMPAFLAQHPIVSPMVALLFWVVLLARTLGLEAALSAALVGAISGASSALVLVDADESAQVWVFAAVHFVLAGCSAFVVSASVRALRQQRVLRREERRAAHRQATLAKALKEALHVRESFLGVAGHELRSPVTGALLHAQRWQRRCTDEAFLPDAHRDAWQRQVRQLGRLTKLMEGLLDASHLAHGSMQLHPESLDVCALVREVIDRLSEAACRANCPIALRLPNDGFYGRLDRLRVEQVVENLVCNALKYGAGKPIDVVLARQEDLMSLSVTDRGIGIDESHHRRIFAPYERLAPSIATDCQPAGLGLGLWLVRQVVAAAGGEAEVDSKPGCGATFTVRLPC